MQTPEPPADDGKPVQGSPVSANWWSDPVVWGFVLLAGAGIVVSSIESGGWPSNLVFVSGVLVSVVLVLLLSRKRAPPHLDIARSAFEYRPMLAYYLAFMVLATLTKGEGILANEFAKWVWFVVLPILLLFLLRGRLRGLAGLLQSIGLRRQGLGKALLLGLLGYAAFVPALPFLLPATQLDRLKELLERPIQFALLLPASFLLSLVTAATTEETFFRGILQSRLSRFVGSELRSCLVTAFLFGIYHLPYAYFSSSWPTHGNLVWAVSSVLAEQMMMGLVLGVLWLRTHNIAAPVLLHALVDTIAIMTMLKFGGGPA